MAKGTQARAKKAAKRAIDAERIVPAITKKKGKAPKSGGGGDDADDHDDGGAAGAGPGSSESQQQSRVVYIGHLPHGFYEKQLLGFFSQFGKLTRVRLSRSKKTGKAKHYAFLEFQYPEVAQVAADAMNGYFMFSQKLDVKVMPVEKIHPELFKAATRRFKTIPWSKIERRRHDKDLTPQELARRVARAIKKDEARRERIAEAGIKYEYPPLASLVPAKPKRKVFHEEEEEEE